MHLSTVNSSGSPTANYFSSGFPRGGFGTAREASGVASSGATGRLGPAAAVPGTASVILGRAGRRSIPPPRPHPRPVELCLRTSNRWISISWHAGRQGPGAVARRRDVTHVTPCYTAAVTGFPCYIRGLCACYACYTLNGAPYARACAYGEHVFTCNSVTEIEVYEIEGKSCYSGGVTRRNMRNMPAAASSWSDILSGRYRRPADLQPGSAVLQRAAGDARRNFSGSAAASSAWSAPRSAGLEASIGRAGSSAARLIGSIGAEGQNGGKLPFSCRERADVGTLTSGRRGYVAEIAAESGPRGLYKDLSARPALAPRQPRARPHHARRAPASCAQAWACAAVPAIATREGRSPPLGCSALCGDRVVCWSILDRVSEGSVAGVTQAQIGWGLA
jgi:hypothetical protein